MSNNETIGSLLRDAADKLGKAAELTHSMTLQHLIIEARDEVSCLLLNFATGRREPERFSDGTPVRNVQDDDHESNQ